MINYHGNYAGQAYDDGIDEDLDDEKKDSSGENGRGRKDDQLSELEKLRLLLVLDHTHY